MMRKVTVAFFLIVLFNVAAFGADAENNFQAISAEQAFDAQVKQVDPTTGESSKVALIDIRSAAEYHWIGAPAKVDMIVTTDGKEIKPYLGKVRGVHGHLSFITQNGDDFKSMFLSSDEVSEIFTDPISINIPFENWDEDGREMVENKNFKQEIEALAGKYDVLIIMCRSGKRSSKCDFNSSLFKAVYEIDGAKNGRGGFQGSSYEDIYNGYRGWPGRRTPNGENKSVSWSDTGLPIHIGWTK
jgi:rhodanese-related sulfurtransferase